MEHKVHIFLAILATLLLVSPANVNGFGFLYFDSELTSARANSGLFNLSEVQPTSFANEFFRCNFADPTPEDPNPCFLRLNTTDPNWTLPSSVSSVEITVTWAFNDQLSNPCCVSDPMETASYPQQGVAVGVRDLLFKQIFNARNEPCPDAFITDSIDVTTEGWTFNGNECEIVGGAFCETNAIRVTLGSCSITPGSSLLSAMTQDSTSRVIISRTAEGNTRVSHIGTLGDVAFTTSGDMLAAGLSWFGLGVQFPQSTASGAFTMPEYISWSRVSLRFAAQCFDANSADGDGCNQQLLIEPFYACETIGTDFHTSNCTKFVGDTAGFFRDREPPSRVHVGLLDQNRLDDTYNKTLDMNMTSELVFFCSSCRNDVADNAFMVGVDGVFEEMTPTYFQGNEARFDLTGKAAVGKLVQLVWWMRPKADQANDALTPLIYQFAVSPVLRLTQNNLVVLPALEPRLPSGPINPELNRLRSFSFPSNLPITAAVDVYLYDTPSDASSTVDAGSSTLVLLTSTCRFENSSRLYTCNATVPALTTRTATAALAVRLRYPNLIGESSTTAISTVVQMPIIDASPSIFAQNALSLSITGQYFLPESSNTSITLTCDGIVVSGSYDSSQTSTNFRTFFPSGNIPMTSTPLGNLSATVSYYGYQIEIFVGLVHRVPIISISSESFYPENNTLIITGSLFYPQNQSAHVLRLTQTGVATPIGCEITSVSATRISCRMTSPRPENRIIEASISLFGGQFTAPVVIGSYSPSLINTRWRPEDANPSWPFMTYSLATSATSTTSVEIPPESAPAAIASQVAQALGIPSASSISVRYRLDTTTQALSLTIYFADTVAQDRFFAAAVTSNDTLKASLLGFVRTSLTGSSYLATYVSGTATDSFVSTFSGPFIQFNISGSGTIPPTSAQLFNIRNRTAIYLRLLITDISVRASTAKRATLATFPLELWFPTQAATDAYWSNNLASNSSFLAEFNSIVNQESGFSTTLVASTPPPVTVAPVQPGGVTGGGATLGTGAIAGIAVAAVVVVIVVIVAVVVVFRRFQAIKKSKERAEATAAEISEKNKEIIASFSIKNSEVKIGQKLGEGSFGAVFKGEYAGKDVAIKKLTASMLGAQVDAFFREATLMFSIKPHKNVVRMYGMSQEMGNLMMIMEFLPGGSLDGWMEKRGVSATAPIEIAEFYHFARGIAVGMRHLAKTSVVHRDLATRNILLDGMNPPTPKIADFGFSRVVSDEDAKGKTNSTVGPIRWMAPENLRDQTYSEKSDVWAYGALLVELLTGAEPFPGQDIITVAVNVRDGKFTALDFVPKTVKPPKWVKLLIKSCFTYDADERPSFQDVIDVLDNNVPAGVTINKAEEDTTLTDIAATTQTRKQTVSGKGGAKPTGTQTNSGTKKPVNYASTDVLADDNGGHSGTKTNKTNKTAKPKSNYSDGVELQKPSTSTRRTDKSSSAKPQQNTQGNYTAFAGEKPAPDNYAVTPETNAQQSSFGSDSSSNSGSDSDDSSASESGSSSDSSSSGASASNASSD